ncbi:farnesol dehydrogenase-like [Adelges cooleyi]|uniref:farnesol dehydrogenase-like n=1 Tax=Adelges cooleyi TaxID=133065 RepID=UPI00217FFB12|nr:farnesol dehydrogenase-like [Adelges cooleyi]
MEQWKGTVALVTGASAGIGHATTLELLKHGVHVVALARRGDKLRDIPDQLPKNSNDTFGKLYPMECDITDENTVKNVFSWIDTNLGGISIMINNAGILRKSTLLGGKTEDWKSILDLNVLALSVCTREAYQSMTKHNINGYIIQINSIVGHSISSIFGNKMYNASKKAVTVLCDGLRHELQLVGSKIKVTSLSPGLVDTEIFAAGNCPLVTEGVSNPPPSLTAKTVADTVILALSTPPDVLFAELTVIRVGATIQNHMTALPPFTVC